MCHHFFFSEIRFIQSGKKYAPKYLLIFRTKNLGNWTLFNSFFKKRFSNETLRKWNFNFIKVYQLNFSCTQMPYSLTKTLPTVSNLRAPCFLFIKDHPPAAIAIYLKIHKAFVICSFPNLSQNELFASSWITRYTLLNSTDSLSRLLLNFRNNL